MTFATRNKRLANINATSQWHSSIFWFEDVGSTSTVVYGHFSCASACYGFPTRYVFFSIYDCWTVLSNLLVKYLKFNLHSFFIAIASVLYVSKQNKT